MRMYRSFKPNMLSQSENFLLFQEDLNNICSWTKTWDLNFNVSKCCILHFGRSNVQSQYKINDNILTNKRQEKDLGVLFSSNFNFNDHMDTIFSNANRQLGIIAHVFKHRNLKTVVPLYKSLVRPLLEYSSVVWSPYTCTKKYIQKLESIQEKNV